MKMNVNPQEKHTMFRSRTGSGSDHSDHRRPLRFISVLFFSSESRSFLLRRGSGASSSTWVTFGSAGVSNTSSVTSCVITSCSSLRFSFRISFTICLSFCLAAVASRIIRRCWTNIKHSVSVKRNTCKNPEVFQSQKTLTMLGDWKWGFSYSVGPPKLPWNILMRFKTKRGPISTRDASSSMICEQHQNQEFTKQKLYFYSALISTDPFTAVSMMQTQFQQLYRRLMSHYSVQFRFCSLIVSEKSDQ